MAIDTREKRQSVAWVQTGLVAPTLTPNATPDKEWRQNAGWGYMGIAAAAPGGPSAVPPKWHHLNTLGHS